MRSDADFTGTAILVVGATSGVGNETPARRDGALAGIPAGRMGEPADAGGAALFVVSPAANDVDGRTVVVNGGLSL